jgi:hypothetical protein
LCILLRACHGTWRTALGAKLLCFRCGYSGWSTRRRAMLSDPDTDHPETLSS